ncbi:hypothetical protein NY08_2616 [Rhodococcus sp. B7740]|nr:hypothetical protein NY08_2616 [Rhodococcus sp. B7740]
MEKVRRAGTFFGGRRVLEGEGSTFFTVFCLEGWGGLRNNAAS